MSTNLPAAADWYLRRRVRKARGWREISEPAPWLLETQRRILRDVLDRLDPGPYAHGFVKGRSALTYARPHCGRNVVVRFDLADFFGSVSHDAVLRVFLDHAERGFRLQHARMCLDPSNATGRGLPQGAPTSPALANLAARGLDARLAKLAHAHGTQGLTYSRYADDFALSGNFCDVLELVSDVRDAVRAEGFALNERKTRVMWSTLRQELAGLVVNGAEPRPPREVRDRARAAAHRGGEDASARGLVSYVDQMGGVRR